MCGNKMPIYCVALAAKAGSTGRKMVKKKYRFTSICNFFIVSFCISQVCKSSIGFCGI